MDYKKIHHIKNIRLTPVLKDELLLHIDKPTKKLRCLNRNNFELLWETKEKAISFTLKDELILCTYLKIIDLKGNLIYSENNPFSYEKLHKENITLWKLVDNEKEVALYSLFDLGNLGFTKQNFLLKGVPVILEKDILISRELKCFNCYDLTDFQLQWQFDIAQFGTYKENKIFADQEPEEKRREIYRVYYHQDKIIASISRAIIALNPQSGELLWKIDFEDYTPVDIVFDGNKGYMGDIAYYVIDIDKGEVILKSRFDENIEIEGDKIRWVTSGSGLVLHQGFLWCVFGENKRCYLAKINPVNGKLLDAMSLDTQAPSAKPPVFNENRVYILDQDGELFIYEEQI
jgi:outer membrane protein assembly factor BamB